MELASEKLRKELEAELKLSTDHLRSHAWYHGCLPRKEAESLLQEDGEFLIRDSRSSAGDYVLSCSWGGQALHFKIIRVVLRPRKGYSRTLFQFEQEQFDNVPALVRFYVGNRKAVSDTSGAVVSRPVNRSVPLRWLEERHGDSSQPSRLVKKDGAPARRLSFRAATASEERVEANLLRAKDRSGSDPSSLDQLDRRPSLHSAHSDSNLLTGTGSPEPSPGVQDRTPLPPLSPVFRTGSDPVLRPNAPSSRAQGGLALSGSEGRLHSKAPPKPLRAPSMLVSDYCELVPKAPEGARSHVERLRGEERWRVRAHLTETAFGFLDSDGSCPSPRPGDAEEEDPGFQRPLLETASSFQPRLFHSLLLPPDNKPLDPKALKSLKGLFAQHDCRTMALHILQVDCQAAWITGVSKEQRQAMGVSSGLELVTLPQGHQLRKDLLERHHLIALGIAVDVLGCTGAVAERAAALQKIIQLAEELWRSAGDLFAFSAVMKALQLPQIMRLEQTWRHLRQNHTRSAIAFEKELKPLLGRLNRAEGNAVPSCECVCASIPSGVTWWQADASGGHCEWVIRPQSSLSRPIPGPQSMYWLHSPRPPRDSPPTLTPSALSLLPSAGFQAIPELREAFQTEFALLLFWGSKGAEADRTERHRKFDRILTVLSQKLE
ncbi:PREDICTED: breast cancer anti-estrogen resistance protein 3-like [Gekko japonicus]|uniref:Breast cancer anti-estrogen resistance protein 3-like n=1 Tax=Gekko japonicus TaxID=146911 RepID=A0ABM1L569_GEKJA|nr:PREDICTED: breast cancer anti-estrogen resistance protein 3-like [Gekko japonicus]